MKNSAMILFWTSRIGLCKDILTTGTLLNSTIKVPQVNTLVTFIRFSLMSAVTICILWYKQVIMVQLIELIQKQWDIISFNMFQSFLNHNKTQLFTAKWIKLENFLFKQHTSVKYERRKYLYWEQEKHHHYLLFQHNIASVS